MSIVNGIVKAPLGLYEIAALLGEPVDVGSVCTSSNIRKYAKYKPIVHNSIGTVSDAMRKQVNHGFTPTSVVVSGSNIPKYMPNWGEWRVPNPLEDEPCRLVDFINEDNPSANGYNHYAIPFLREVKIDTSHKDRETLILNTTSRQGQINVLLSFNWSAELQFKDFHGTLGNSVDMADMYLCAALISTYGLSQGNLFAISKFSPKISSIQANDDYVDLSLITHGLDNTLYNNLISRISTYPLLFIVGLTETNVLSQNMRFWSPIIFKEWAEYTWLRQYDSYKQWDGNKSTLNYYFTGGWYYNRTGYNFVSTASLTYDLFLTNEEYQVLYYTPSLGTTDPNRDVSCVASYSLELTQSGNANNRVELSGDLTIGSRYRLFEGNPNDKIANIKFPAVGTYTGTLTLKVDGTTVNTEVIDGEVAAQTIWQWQESSQLRDYRQTLTIPVSVYVT